MTTHTPTPVQTAIAQFEASFSEADETQRLWLQARALEHMYVACNAHAELVAALDATRKELYRLAMKAPDLNPSVDRVLRKAELALALADGKERP